MYFLQRAWPKWSAVFESKTCKIPWPSFLVCSLPIPNLPIILNIMFFFQSAHEYSFEIFQGPSTTLSTSGAFIPTWMQYFADSFQYIFWKILSGKHFLHHYSCTFPDHVKICWITHVPVYQSLEDPLRKLSLIKSTPAPHFSPLNQYMKTFLPIP